MKSGDVIDHEEITLRVYYTNISSVMETHKKLEHLQLPEDRFVNPWASSRRPEEGPACPGSFFQTVLCVI